MSVVGTLNKVARARADRKPRGFARAIPQSIRGRLILLTVSVLLPALAVSALLLWKVEEHARRGHERQRAETARALALVVDRQLGERSALIDGLAVSQALQRANWADFYRQAEVATGASKAWVVVYRRDGQQLVNTRLPWGERLPKSPIQDMSTAWAGKRGPETGISNLLIGPVARQPVIAVMRPVTLADGSRVGLGVVTLASDFDRVFTDQGFPEHWTASIVDGTGSVVTRNRDAAEMVGRLASADMRAAMSKSASGLISSRTLDGIPTRSAFAATQGYNWGVIVGVPRADMMAAAGSATMFGLVFSLALLSGGLVLAGFVARSVSRPVEALAEAARTWNGRDTIPAVQGGVAEVDHLAQALTDAVARLRHRDQALTESQTRLNLALQASGAGVWDWDLTTDRVDWSPELYRLLGLSPEVVGEDRKRAWRRAVHSDDLPAVEAQLRQTATEGTPFTFDLRIVRAEGTAWVRSHGAAIIGQAAKPVRLIGVNTDVTDLRNREEQLRQTNAELTSTVGERTRELDQVWRLSRDPLLIMAADGAWLRVNPAWTEILGWSEADLLGRSSAWMQHKDDRAATRAQLQRLSKGHAVHRFENRFRTRSGDYRWFSWTAVQFEGLNYCTARDVTAEKEAAAELERAQEALRHAQKMDAMGQLTGGVAHDFNNLLTPILGSLDFLHTKGVGLDDRGRRLVDGALQSAEKAKTLVQRLLAFARRQPLQPTAVDVGRLVHSMTDLIAGAIGPRIALTVVAPDDLPAAYADQNQLEMALLNLAVNARDAMPDGGALSVIASAQTVGRGKAADLAAGPYVCLAVVDTGAGMPPETVARAIEPFFSTKGLGQGTGRGLSMVHGLAAQLGGALRIDSEPGHGTRIELWLPQAEASRAATPPEPSVERKIARRKRGVALLVDDEDLVRASTADMLLELGYKVVEAASAAEALVAVDAGLKPDVVVTDHLMPGMTGSELAERLASSDRPTPVLIISGYAEAEGLSATLPRLTKPFRQTELASALADLSEPAAPQASRAAKGG